MDDFGTRDVDYKIIEGLEIGSPALKKLSVNWRPTVYPTFACPRQRFDQVIFEKAVQGGSTYLHAHVEDVIFDNDKLIGILTRDQREFRAGVVIAADGYASAIARRAGFELSKGSAVVSTVRAYDRLKQPVKPYFHMHFLAHLRPGYAWLFPLGGDLANVGLGLAASPLNSAQLRQALIDYLRAWWDNSVEIQPDTMHQWPIPLWNHDQQARYRNGIFITGDAGAFVDPLTGGGISAAVLTGTWAAQAIDQYLKGEISLEQAGARYESTWRQSLKPMLDHMHRVKTWFVNYPLAFSALFNTAHRFPFLKSRILHTLAGEHT
jgi:digeranylgeranylglycerophospholipid reductase